MNEIIVTKENFAALLNAGKITKENLISFNQKLDNYAKEIKEMAIREQQDQDTIKLTETTGTVIGVGTDAGKVILNRTIEEGATQNITFTYSGSGIQSKERVGEFWNSKNEFNLADDIREVVSQNEKLLRDNKVFTEEEFKRILSDGEGDIPKLFDYNLNASNFKNMEQDITIMDKCCSCMLKKDNEYVFQKFLIVDGSGETVNPKLVTKFNVGLIFNFGLQDDLALKNGETINRIKKIAEVRDKVKKIAKLRGNGNLLKLLKTISGIDIMAREMKPYLDQIRPIKHVKKVASLAEGTVKTAYKGIKLFTILPGRIKYRNAKKKKDVKNALKLFKENKKKTAVFNQIEKKADIVRHPIRNATNALANKFKSSAFAKKLAERTKKSLLGKVYGKANDALSTVFKIIGKVISPVAAIIRQIIITSLVILAPIILFLLCFIVAGIGAATSHTNSQLVAIMPLANKSDFDAFQKKYDDLDDEFLMSLENYLADYAIKENLKGEQIKYGINGQNNEEGMQNDDFYNGMYYKFITDKDHEGRSSNIEDVIAIMSIIMTQSQSDHLDVALKVIEWLYDISHAYTYQESPLYACDSACHNIEYKCTDIYHEYTDSDIKYNPFHARKKSGNEYEIYEPNEECPVCTKISDISSSLDTRSNGYDSYVNNIVESRPITKEDYKWCQLNSTTINTCYHGHAHGASGSSHYVSSERPSNSVCDNSVRDVYYTEETDGEGNSHTVSHTYYYCAGHEHKACQGHNYKCCMGHTDIQMNIEIKFYDEMKDIINGYDFGENDVYYQELKNK